METKVAANDMTRVRLMESPGPGHGHRGFLVQRNHESGGIVIVFTACPKGVVSATVQYQHSATVTFLQSPNSARVIFISGHERINGQCPEPAGIRGTKTELLPKTGNVFPATTSEPRHGGAGALGLTTFTGGVRGVCSPLARRSLTTGW
jgi:hypothetical protein